MQIAPPYSRRSVLVREHVDHVKRDDIATIYININIIAAYPKHDILVIVLRIGDIGSHWYGLNKNATIRALYKWPFDSTTCILPVIEAKRSRIV